MSLVPYPCPNNAYDQVWLNATARRVADGKATAEFVATHVADLGARSKVETLFVRLDFGDKLKPVRIEQDTTYGPTHFVNGGKKKPTDLRPAQWYGKYAKLTRTILDTFAPDEMAIYIEPEAPVALVTEAITAALLSPMIFSSKPEDEHYHGPTKVYLLTGGIVENVPTFQAQVAAGKERGDLENLGRFLSSLPLNVINVDNALELIHALFFNPDPTLKGFKHLQPNGNELHRMGLLRAVCRGSGRPGKVIAVQIDPLTGPTEQVDIDVGKGLVFDDGGLDFKGAEHIPQMEKDKSAAMRLIGKALYLVRHRDQLKRTAIITLVLAENRLDGNAMMHDDVIVSYSGKRVKIRNTDAEGRLVLADAVAWLCVKYEKRINRLTTIATLTGGCVMAFGNSASGLMVRGNTRKIFDLVEDVSNACADPVHRLEVLDEDSEVLGGGNADLQNVLKGDKYRSAQKGAAFIWSFVPDWVPTVLHIDMAHLAREEGANMAKNIAPPGGLSAAIDMHLALAT